MQAFQGIPMLFGSLIEFYSVLLNWALILRFHYGLQQMKTILAELL